MHSQNFHVHVFDMHVRQDIDIITRPSMHTKKVWMETLWHVDWRCTYIHAYMAHPCTHTLVVRVYWLSYTSIPVAKGLNGDALACWLKMYIHTSIHTYIHDPSLTWCVWQGTLIFIMIDFFFPLKKTRDSIPDLKCTGSVFVLSVSYKCNFIFMQSLWKWEYIDILTSPSMHTKKSMLWHIDWRYMYIYIYIYIHTHTNTYTHTYIHSGRSLQRLAPVCHL